MLSQLQVLLFWFVQNKKLMSDTDLQQSTVLQQYLRRQLGHDWTDVTFLVSWSPTTYTVDHTISSDSSESKIKNPVSWFHIIICLF